MSVKIHKPSHSKSCLALSLFRLFHVLTMSLPVQTSCYGSDEHQTSRGVVVSVMATAADGFCLKSMLLLWFLTHNRQLNHNQSSKEGS